MLKSNETIDKTEQVEWKQQDLDLVAETLDIKYQVEDNLSGGRALFSASITLKNRCPVVLSSAGDGCKHWTIYFSHLRMVEPNYLPADSCVNLEYAGVSLSHLNGTIFKLSPLKTFKPLQEGDSLTFKFNAQHYSAARSDVLPNWYLHVEGMEPRIIKSTQGETLDFVGPYDTPMKYKRFDYILPSGKQRYDVYQPFSPEVRFSRYPEINIEPSHLKTVIPTPFLMESKGSGLVNIYEGGWRLSSSKEFTNEVKYLSDRLNIPISNHLMKDEENETGKVIALKKCHLKSVINETLDSEAYELDVDSSSQHIQITASTSSGIFYGAQTLLSLCATTTYKAEGIFMDCRIRDAPRYAYRGMHVDVARNMHSKEDIFSILDVMALYKMNKFHFHLTDDEGWRLEIPGLEELTEIGSKRGHDPNEDTCLLPLLGSGPFPTGLGCGYYTVDDYKDILRHAEARHVEVIPEIDMPGHSHAAVRAMRVRYNKLMAEQKTTEAEQYLLTDPKETSNHQALSVQMLAENSMNPGLESTFTFIDKVIKELVEMHKDIQPLNVFHLGGDEVAYEAWDDSPACLALVESKKISSKEDLMEYFVSRVAELVHKHGLELGVWQDGIIVKNKDPFKLGIFPSSKVLVHFWRNVWETGQAFDAHKLANEGYKVVLAPATHLYFDHPYEPDPEERGLFWACRYIDTHKVFRFVPENLLANADVKLTGEKITKLDLELLRESDDFTILKKPENIIGVQGQIWTELVRTQQQLHQMIFPRLIALAERAWHKSPWEALDPKKGKAAQEKEWSSFAHTLGHKELNRLESLRIPYHIPAPGARVTGDGLLDLKSCYPGLPMSYSLDGGESWQAYSEQFDVTAYDEVLVRCSSHQGVHHSRVTKLTIKTYTDSDEQSN
ncbi:beta-hexosaminidase [Biomphalaria glabrata]|nr:beta-hexosaminidase [Biomphalaria glabrata]